MSAIQQSIEDCVKECEVSIILVDTRTSESPWVKYAVQRSHSMKKPMLAIHVHNILDENGQRSGIGNDRFGELERDVFFWQRYHTYRWVIDDGQIHIEHWVNDAVETAAKAA